MLTELGRGGMGVVYKAQHVATGELVAVKTAQNQERKVVAALRGEGRTLQQLRHSGVVRVLATGSAAGTPWYAMELLETSTLEHYHRRLWHRTAAGEPSAQTVVSDARAEWAGAVSQPSYRPGACSQTFAANGELEGALKVYRKLADVLAHVHGVGLVHRDLKPANVFLREDRSPVLADFGLAARAFGSIGRESLAAGEERLLGTPAYVAPEQILGRLVDARADLYSLGCMLFEVLTGQIPFATPGTSSILCQHLYSPPLPPSELVDGVPADLDRLVLCLLEKDPKQRTVSAEAVEAVLAHVTGEAKAAAYEDRPVQLYRPSLAGRADALALLQGCRASAAAGRGQLVLLYGESGIGKTYLASEVARLAAVEGFHVVTAECQPVGSPELGGPDVSGAPLHAFRNVLQAIIDRCLEEGEGYTRWLFRDRAGVLAAYEPAISDLPGLGDHPAPEALPEEAARRRLLEALGDCIARFSGDVPLLVVLDDLQWADELSLAFLNVFSGRYLPTQSVLLIGTFRAEETTPAIRELMAAPASFRLELERLDGPTMVAVAADMLATPDLPEVFASFLVESASGNPFFLAEYLRTAAAERLIVREHAGWRIPEFGLSDPAAIRMALPRSVGELITRRLDHLDAATRAACEVAAVLGRDFAPEFLAAALRGSQEQTERAIAALRECQILDANAESNLRFVHDRLRETAYDRILPERRRELHRRVAHVLEEHYQGSSELSSRHAVLAHHWSAARVPVRAAQHFTRAAEGAEKAFAQNEAIMFLRGAIREAREVVASGAQQEAQSRAELGRLYEKLGDLESRAGRQELASEAYERALQAIDQSNAIWCGRLVRKTGKTHELRNQYHRALSALEIAEGRLGPEPLETVESSAWRAEWLDLQIARGWAFYWTAPLEEMSALVSRLRPVVERAGSATQRAQFFQLVSLVGMRAERFLLSTRTLRWARKAFEAAQEGDPNERPAIRFTLAFALLFHGSLHEAKAELERVLEEAVRAGDTAVQCRASTYLLIVARRLGGTEESFALAERTLALASSSEMKHYIGAAQASLGWVCLRSGQIARARNLCEEAIASWQAATPSAFPFQWLARWPLLSLALDAGCCDEGREHAVAMLAPSQQRLPGRLSRRVEAVSLSSAGSIADELRKCRSAANRLSFV